MCIQKKFFAIFGTDCRGMFDVWYLTLVLLLLDISKFISIATLFYAWIMFDLELRQEKNDSYIF